MADTFDVIMAAYPSVGLARQDFDGLVQLVKDKRVRTEGVILVEHDEDGEVRVTETGDHLGRKGLGWGGGVGAVVGLFSPPLLASAVVGAAAGGVAGVFARHRVRERHPDRDRGAAPAGLGRHHRRGQPRRPAGSRAGATRLADDVRRADGAPQHGRPQGGAGHGRRASSAPTARCCRSRTRPSGAPSAAHWRSRRPTGPST